MSHTNTTTNYGLPQFLSSDKPAWMADINVAFADIDGQMKTNADAASAAQTTANDAVLNGAPGYSNLSTYAVGDVVNYLGRVYKCDIAVTTPEAFDNAKWSYYRLSDASAQLDVIDGEIGSTDISGIGDGSITGAISAVNSNLTYTNFTNDIVTASAARFTIGRKYGYKVGNRVHVELFGTTNSNIATSDWLVEIPVDGTGIGNKFGTITINGSTYPCSATIESSGTKMYISPYFNNINANEYVGFIFDFVLQ